MTVESGEVRLTLSPSVSDSCRHDTQVEDWHASFSDPSLADAVLDRQVHNAYRVDLRGIGMRKLHSPLR